MDMACTRMRRALPGQLVRPIMSMTFIMLEPNSATTIITRKKVGSIKNILMISEIHASTRPPRYPAAPPTSVPTTPEISAASTPTISDVRAPSRIIEKTSRPFASVPIRWLAQGAAFRSSPSL